MFKKIILSVMVLVAPSLAQAVTVNELPVKAGVEAFFVESHALPMISVQIAFRAGEAFEPEGKEGLAILTASLMNEGAGRLDSEEFQQALQEIGARLGAGADTLNFNVNLTTLTKNKDKAFDLLKLALLKPRFDKVDFQRMKTDMITSIKESAQSPSSVLAKEFDNVYYGTHPYGRTPTVKSVEALTVKDVRAFYAKQLTQKNMVVSVVGDITADDLQKKLEDVLEDLPEGAEFRNEMCHFPPTPLPKIVRVQMSIPQTHIMMGHTGIDRQDPDYYAAYTLNYILGGGGFNSHLMEEVREKRGLAYSVYSFFEPMPIYGRFIAAVQTKNENAEKAISLMKKEIEKMRDGQVTQEELDNAKRYLVGSFPLRINTNSKILGYLSVMQMEHLGIDYLDNWSTRIEAVTLDDLKRVAKRLLNPEDLVIVSVGGEAN